MLSKKSALTRFGAFIKSSLLLGLEKIQRNQATRAIRDLKLAVHEKIANERTPGAFGSSMPQKRQRRPKWMRANAARVRGY